MAIQTLRTRMGWEADKGLGTQFNSWIHEADRRSGAAGLRRVVSQRQVNWLALAWWSGQYPIPEVQVETSPT